MTKFHHYEFELVDPFMLDVTLGWLDTVSAGKITEDVGADYVSSASITVNGDELPPGALVRIWHIEEDESGSNVREEMGTFMQDVPSMEWGYQGQTGSIPLYSTLSRLVTDERGDNLGIPASTKIVPWFEQIVVDSGGTPWVHPSLDRDRTFVEDWVWEFGKSAYAAALRAADALSCIIVPDAHGRVCLTPRPVMGLPTLQVPAGAASFTEAGLKIIEPDPCNRVCCKYERGDIVRTVEARLDPTHPWHYLKLGRWRTQSFDEKTLDIEGVSTYVGTYDASTRNTLEQQFVVEDQNPDRESDERRIVRLKSRANGLYLDVRDEEYRNEAPVRVWAGNSGDGQKWVIHQHGDNEFSLHPKGDESYALTTASSMAGGSGTWLWEYSSSSPEMRWRWDDHGDYVVNLVNLGSEGVGSPVALTSEDDVTTALEAKAQSRLDSLSQVRRQYSSRMLYLRGTDPWATIGFAYEDANGNGVDAVAMVVQREITLDGQMSTQITVEEVR